MHELFRTNDFVLISAVEAFLKAADISHAIFDQNMSVLDGSIGILPRRMMVLEEDAERAEKLLKEVGLWPE